MLNKYIQMEVDYRKFFSDCRAYEHYLEFDDSNIPELYDHNFIMFKEKVSPAIVYNTILFQIEKRKCKKANFLKVIFFEPTNLHFINRLTIKPHIIYYDGLSIETKAFKTLKGNPHGVVKLAKSDKVYDDGCHVHILSNKKEMGIDFATRRIMRKIETYRKKDSLDYYVCYGGGEAVGNVELGYNKEVAKIENLDIIPSQQRKGYGTFVLSEMLHQAYNKGVTEAYLITEKNNAKKDMYKKCGFKPIGQIIELLFEF